MRVRQSGADCILGVKNDAHAHGGYFERDEEEAPLPSSKVDLNVLDGRISSELMEIVGEKALAPRFGSDIRRTLKMLKFHGADIEVALDEGFLFAGKRREPTDEVELELKAGEPAALFEFGLALVDALPLTLPFSARPSAPRNCCQVVVAPGEMRGTALPTSVFRPFDKSRPHGRFAAP